VIEWARWIETIGGALFKGEKMNDESLSDLYWCFLSGFCLAILIVKSDEILKDYVRYETIRVNEEHRLGTVIHNESIPIMIETERNDDE